MSRARYWLLFSIADALPLLVSQGQVSCATERYSGNGQPRTCSANPKTLFTKNMGIWVELSRQTAGT